MFIRIHMFTDKYKVIKGFYVIYFIIYQQKSSMLRSIKVSVSFNKIGARQTFNLILQAFYIAIEFYILSFRSFRKS